MSDTHATPSHPVSPVPASGTVPQPVFASRIGEVGNRQLITAYRFLTPHMLAPEPLLNGAFTTDHFDSGLILHRVDATDLKDGATESLLTPSLKLVFLCGGCTEVAYGRRFFRLVPPHPHTAATADTGVLMAVAEPERFRRNWRVGRSERKISLSIPPAWLDTHLPEDGLAEARRIHGFAATHEAIAPWQPDQRLLALAQRLLAPPEHGASLQRLFLETAALELAYQALAGIARGNVPPQAAAMARPLTPRERRLVDGIRELIDSGEANGLSLQQILQKAGTSSSRIQQRFRQLHGCTIYGYQRQRHLQQAFDALYRDGIDVARAADIAGYSSAANFATAFKRLFRITPREARQRHPPSTGR